LHGQRHGFARSVLRLGVFVPGHEHTVRAEGGKSSEFPVEGDVVDSIDLPLSSLRLLLLPMALKAEIRVVNVAKVLAVKVIILNTASAFN